MAGYNPSAFYGAVFDASDAMLARQQKDQDRFDKGLNSLSKSVPDAIKTQKMNALMQASMDPNTGKIDQQKYITGLAQIDPQKAFDLQQKNEDNDLNRQYKNAQISRLGTQQSNDALTGQKIQAQTQTENARYTAQQAIAFAKNLDNNSKMTSNLMSVLDGVNTQADYDSMINAAERSGIASPEIIEQFKGQTLTPELKNQVKSLLMTNKDNVEQARKQLLTEHQIQNIDNQSINRDANTALNTAKLQETMDNNQNNLGLKERQVSNQERSTQAQIDSNAQKQQNADSKSNKEDNAKVIEAQKQYESNATTLDNITSLVQKMLANPALDSMAGGGKLSELKANIPSKLYGLATGEDGNPNADFASDLETFRSQQFLQNIQAMKGLGALSDAEGRKINSAAGSINYNISGSKLRSILNNVLQSANKMKQLDQKYLNDMKSNYGGSSSNNSSTNNTNNGLTMTNNSGNINGQAPVSSGAPQYSQDQMNKFAQWEQSGLQ